MNKKIRSFLLLVLALSTLVLCACGNKDSAPASTAPETTAPVTGDIPYAVKVLDASGKPYSEGVIVKFMQEGKQVAMQPVNAEGIATKTLPAGDYTLEFVFTADNSTAYCDTAEATVSSQKKEATVTIYAVAGGEGVDLTAAGGEYKALPVTVGGTYVKLAKQTRNYFLFSPTEAGTYTISVDPNTLVIGNYGSPHFVQGNSTSEVKDGAFTVSVSESMIGDGSTGTSTYVIGIDGTDTDGGCLLSILRTGDPAWSVEAEPWTEYKTTHTPTPFTLTVGDKKLTYVDITGTTADNQVVFNETDGYYHFGTADGPVVYVDLGKNSPNISLQVMIQGDGPMGGAPLRNYFWTGEGHNKENFVKKEDYTNIMVSYFDNMDETLGVYPLTQDLVYIIQNACADWWDETSPNFVLEGWNPEIGWMFALCYLA